MEKMPNVDPDPLCSNIYSIPERILLLWMNHIYEQQRSVVWKNCAKGEPIFISFIPKFLNPHFGVFFYVTVKAIN